MAEICASCKAPIVWAVTERGKRMPVNAQPVEDGTILLSHRGRFGSPPTALVQSKRELEVLRRQHEHSPQEGSLRLFTSHFATCPQAARHRTAKSETAAR